MSCIPEGIVFEDSFQFDQLDYLVYRRFLELLRPGTWFRFLHTNKKHYQDYITSVGIDMLAFKIFGLGEPRLTEEGGSIFFATAEDYRFLEEEHSKFWPYFKFKELSIDFDKWDGKMMDRGPIPVPKTYRRLVVWDAKQSTDIDYLVKEALHPGVEMVAIGFKMMELDTVRKLVNYALKKIPGVSEYCFRIRRKTDIPKERVLQLFEPPPTTREMTSSTTDTYTYVWYRQKKDL